jgi:hypothetical protein
MKIKLSAKTLEICPLLQFGNGSFFHGFVAVSLRRFFIAILFHPGNTIGKGDNYEITKFISKKGRTDSKKQI